MHNQRAQQVGERSFNPWPRDEARDTNALPKDRHPHSRPRAGIRISEGCETRLGRGDAAASKGKIKDVVSSNVVSSGNTLSGEKPTSPPSLEALMSNLSLFDEPLLKDPDEEVLTLLGEVYSKEAIKGVQELLKDATPFKMAASLSTFPICCLLSIYVYTFYLLPVILHDSCR